MRVLVVSGRICDFTQAAAVRPNSVDVGLIDGVLGFVSAREGYLLTVRSPRETIDAERFGCVGARVSPDAAVIATIRLNQMDFSATTNVGDSSTISCGQSFMHGRREPDRREQQKNQHER